jgi:iron complex outermembrane receptor protein
MQSTQNFRRAALASAIGMAIYCPAHAQTTSTTLDPVVVTGNPLGSRDIAAPVSVLTGDELTLRRGSSLGDTLNSTPGVSSSYFGPNANRPVIRGLDGDRVRILSNAGASLDASSLSFDHAVPIDPLFVERLEVLRGPGALLYGGSAVGGVVNALDNRIPTERMKGVSGAAELRLGGAQNERGGAALVETGNDGFALHADAFGRQTDDLRAPNFHVPNSASRTHGGAVGSSLFFDQGHIGLSADTYDSRYGVVVEPDVSIQMKRDHVGVAGEIKFGEAAIRSLKAQFNHTRYEHQEIEGTGTVGTTFKTSGDELRVEAQHAPLGPLRGMFGAQVEDFDFSALGEEAFVPTTRTRRQALFALEELPWAGGTLTAGLRLERAHVSSEGDADPLDAKFGPAAERSFSLRSASLANVFKLSPQWALSGALSYSERAPTSFELYANGVHAATSAYERGDTTLDAERGNNIDLALEWKEGTNQLRIGAFSARFSRFIALEATGNNVTVDGEDFPEYNFRSVRARLNGIEVNGKQRLLDGSTALDLSGKLDLTRGSNLDTGEPLPRVAPLRVLVGLDASHGLWGGRIELDHAARQDRVPSTDTPTAGYTMLNLSATRRFTLQGSDALWFVQLTNAGNALGYNAASIQTVRELSPLPGRALKTGLRVSF